MHRLFRPLALSAACAVLVGALAIPADAIPPGGFNHPATSSLMLPVNGPWTPLDPLESVQLAGRVHVVTTNIPGNPVAPIGVFINLADVKGVGDNSGVHYVAVGAFQGKLIPGNPIYTLRPTFTIMPVGYPGDPSLPPNPIMPITFNVTLTFDAAGNLLQDGTSAQTPNPSP